MSIPTICKFQVQEVTRQHWNCAKANEPPKYAERIKFSAVCASESLEDQSFSQATPQGELTITVSNPEIIGTFDPGAYYYLRLIPCPAKA